MGCTAKLSSSRNQLLIFAYLTVCNFAILDLHLFTQLKKPKGIDFVESFNHEKDKDLTLMKQDIKYPLWCIVIIGHKYPEILVEPQLKSVSGCHFTLTKTVFFLKKTAWLIWHICTSNQSGYFCVYSAMYVTMKN